MIRFSEKEQGAVAAGRSSRWLRSSRWKRANR